MNKINVLVVTFHTKELIECMIRSFERFKPEGLEITYVIVENSSDVSYKAATEALVPGNVIWINHSEGELYQSSHGHGLAYDIGKKQCQEEWTFVSHSDTCVTSTSFFNSFFDKMKEGFDLVGVCYDAHPDRIKAVHCSGYFVRTSILNSTTMLPDLPVYDTTDYVTKYCRDNDHKIHVFRNTYNDRNVTGLIDEPFKSWGPDCGVDRCLGPNNDIIFMHLGRGTSKQQNAYYKEGKMLHSEWLRRCEEILSDT